MRVSKTPAQRRAAWQQAAELLEDGRSLEAEGKDVVDAHFVATLALAYLQSLADPTFNPTKRREIALQVREIRKIMAGFTSERSERLARLKAMKRAVERVANNPFLHAVDPNDDVSKSMAKMAGTSLKAELARQRRLYFEADWPMPLDCPTAVLDAALEAAIDRKMSAVKRYAALHALAHHLRCSTKSDESFRTEYARLKV